MCVWRKYSPYVHISQDHTCEKMFSEPMYTSFFLTISTPQTSETANISKHPTGCELCTAWANKSLVCGGVHPRNRPLATTPTGWGWASGSLQYELYSSK